MKTSSQPAYVVFGATGAIGYAVTKELLQRGWPVTILVRNPAKARELFGEAAGLEILQGDAMQPDDVERATAGKQVVVHAINYPYQHWEEFMLPVTENLLEAAAMQKATVLFPGNVYNYGKPENPIKETDVPQPITKKGRIRQHLEQRLAQAAEEGLVRVINVRLPDFFGPNVTNAGFAPIFEGALQKKPMPWVVNADIPHQLVYTLDAGRFMVEASLREYPEAYTILNYAGTTVPSMRQWLQQIATVAGAPAQVRVYPKILFKIMGWFQAGMREVEEMLYLFEGTVLLDDSLRKKQFPAFKETPMEEALETTLQWFADFRLKSEKQAKSSRLPEQVVRSN